MRHHWIVIAILLHVAAASTAVAQSSKARFARPVGQDDQLGLTVSRERMKIVNGRTVSAVVGLWGDQSAVELGAFEDRGAAATGAGAAQAVRLVSGRGVSARGVRLTGSLYEAPDQRGWSVAVDARHQRTQDVEAMMRGEGGRTSDSRLLLSGKLKF